MDKSTLTKAPAPSKTKKENESLMKHIVELNERITYVMDALKNQAEMVKNHDALLERVRSRMGL